jgi:hypothetical protein
MTVSNTLRRAGPSTGDGVTTAFPFTFKVFAATDIVVTELASPTSEEVQKTLTTHYTVTLNPDQDTTPGGTVTAVAAPAAGVKWTITSAVPALQGTELTNGSGFYPQVIEDSLDKLTILIQQLQELQSRSLLLPLSFNLTALLPTPVAFYRLGWNEAGDELVNYAPGVGDVTVQNVWEANQRVVPVALVSGATVNVDAALSNTFTLTAAHTFTLANPTNLADGMILNFRFKQDATGGRVVTWGSKFKFPNGAAGVLSTAANAVDFMSCYYDGPSDTLDCVLNKAFA